MAIVYQIPHTSRFIATTTAFVGTFNVPTPGVYDFGSTLVPVAANTNVRILQFQPNAVYFIERMSLGADVAEETYLASITTLPTLSFRKELQRTAVYERVLPCEQLIDNREVGAWVFSDRSDDWLTLSLTGVLTQVPATVGKATINLYVGLSIFQVDSNWYTANFRNVLRPGIGAVLRGGKV